MAKVLTAKAVETAKPHASRREIPDCRLPGLYLVVQPSGAKGWAVRYRHNGKPRKFTLGKFPLLSLAVARDRAREALATVSVGDDPGVKDRREADTVAALASDFIARHVSKTKSGTETSRIFEREVLPVWGNRKAGEITRRNVIDLCDSIADRGAPYMANRVLAAIRKMFNWAVSRDILKGSPCIGVKPPAQERSRDRILADDEIAVFWKATGALGYPYGPVFRLLLLTGQRLQEVAQMEWVEIEGTAWAIPGDRTKNGEPHRVHMSDPALLVLSGVPHIKGARLLFSFDGHKRISGFSRAKQKLDRYMVEIAGQNFAHWKLHDLRRTFSTGLARCGVDLVVAEKCLNHLSGALGGVAGVYNRFSYTDEMRQAWSAWAAQLMEITGDASGAVVPFRGAP
jgi:integrase